MKEVLIVVATFGALATLILISEMLPRADPVRE